MRGQPILGESTQLCRELSDKKDTQATKRIIQEKLLILTLLGSFLVLKNFTRLFILSIFFFCLSGEIGGQLGLCIGASLLTLLEFCDVIFTILKIRFGRAG